MAEGENVRASALSSSKWFHDEVAPHEPMLRAYLHKLFPSLGDIDDVVQEAHLRLLKAREKGRIESAKAYLFAVARNVATGVFRRKRVVGEVPVNEAACGGVLEPIDVGETVSLQQEIRLVVEAIDALPGRCREIVVLRLLHDLSYHEIAERLHLSEATVRVQVARGLKKCACFLRERGVSRGRP